MDRLHEESRENLNELADDSDDGTRCARSGRQINPSSTLDEENDVQKLRMIVIHFFVLFEFSWQILLLAKARTGKSKLIEIWRMTCKDRFHPLTRKHLSQL